MIRVLLALLAVLIAVLAYVLGRPLLYAAAGVSLVTALALVAREWWSTASRRRRPKSGPRERDESLEDLGIMEVRPQSKSGDAASSTETTTDEGSADAAASSAPDDSQAPSTPSSSTTSSSTTPDEEETPEWPASSEYTGDHPATTSASAEADPATSDAPEAEARSAAASDADETDAASPDDRPEPTTDASADETEDRDDPETEGETETPVDAPVDAADAPGRNGVATSDVADAPVLVPFVETVRAALGAHTVCLLVQEDVVLDYDIRAIASAEADVRRTGHFSTQEPLLTATMAQQSVTIRPLDGPEAVEEFLGYYQTDVDIDHVALAPVQRPNDPTTYFLLADARPDTDLGTRRARRLLERFAETLALILEDDGDPPLEALDLSDEVDRSGGSTTTTASEAAAAERAHAAEQDAKENSSPRPRSEIIAEEMAAADEESEPLALVLVHLNRAEALAREGNGVVAQAERKLRGRLEDAAPGSRVTRFGELTYGVFFRGHVGSVEPWAADLERELAEETGMLEGGVSIGVAMRTHRHDNRPEDLRADATEALREAYESGAATIIE